MSNEKNYIDTENEWSSFNICSPMECMNCDKIICYAKNDEPVCPTLFCMDCVETTSRFEKTGSTK